MTIKRIRNIVIDFLYRCKNVIEYRIKYRLPIMNTEESIKFVLKNRCSVARFGDGEFWIMSEYADIGFQERNPELSMRLKEIFEKDNSSLLICLPIYINTFHGLRKSSKEYWTYWRDHHQKTIVTWIKEHDRKKSKALYGNTNMTRPYMDLLNPSYARRVFRELKKIWKDRDILIVEGEKTRLGVGNDLFNNARSIKRILAPAENAFNKYYEILDTIKSCYNGELVLLALGPTATVLAVDLSENEIQAIDVGHIDMEYEWFLMNAKEKVPIPGKYTNEAKNGKDVGECHDLQYVEQIISRVR